MEETTVVKKKRFYTVKEFHAELDNVITRTQIYRMIQAGQIPVRKIGTKIVIPADWVDAYLNAPAVAVKIVKETA